MQAAESRAFSSLALPAALLLSVLSCSSPDSTLETPGGGTNSGGAQAAAGQAGSAPAGGTSNTSGGSAAGGSSSAGSGQGGGGGVQSGTSGAGGSSGGAGGTEAMTGGTAGAGGNSGGSGGAQGDCVKGEVSPSEVILIGDSFIALNHSITNALQDLARDAGALGAAETYREVAVSGTTLAGSAGNNIPNQYAQAVGQSPVKVVLMDGGGNDCLINQNGDAAVAPAQALFQKMGQEGTEQVVYFFYPDPFGNDGLKSCLDGLRPKMKEMCESLTSPKCYFLDLRPTWDGHRDYAQNDGIHPTVEGGTATAKAVWKVMQDNCVAQ